MKTEAIVALPVTPPNAGATAGDSDPRRPSAEAAARYRLVIEEGPQNGRFIYKIMDRVTGEVVRQMPREQVMDLIRDRAYVSGQVIDTII